MKGMTNRACSALRIAIIVAGVLLAAFPLRADPSENGQDKPGGSPLLKKVRTVEGVEEYSLDNGLRVLLYPDDSTPKLTVNLTVFVGSRHEGYGETGMAHLLEHMLFKGTPSHANIPTALRDHGADFNATTSYDRTNYFETMRGNDANLEFGLRLEADRFVNSLIRREDLASEMTVVRSEFERGENNAEGILSQRMWAVAYEWHNYGKNTIGNRSDIERVPIENLQAFYKKHYRPDNAILIVSGNFDREKALAYSAKYFGILKKPAQTLDATYTEEPAQDGERTVALRRVGKVAVVGAAYHIPASAHEDFAAVEVLNQILTTAPTGRLYQALVLSKKSSKVSGAAQGLHDPGLLEFSVQVGQGQTPEAVRDLLLDVLEKVQQQQPTTEEVERARRQLLKERELLMNNCADIASSLGEWAAQGEWRLFFLHRDRIAKVTEADVARVAGRYLLRTNRTVGLYLPTEKPERASIPAPPSPAELVKDYQGGTSVVQGEKFDPTPDNIEKRTRYGQLPSGVKTALLPKKTRNEAVILQLTLRYGNEDSLKGLTTAADLLPVLLTRGTKKHTRAQLEDELDKLKARIVPGGDTGKVVFLVECKREKLPAALHLLGEMLREPSFPADEFDVIRRGAIDTYKKYLVEPEALAGTLLSRKLAPYPADDVRYVPTLEESIGRLEAVTVDQVRKLYQEQLGGHFGELAIVGEFAPEPTVKLLEEVLKDWKAGTPYRRIAVSARDDLKGEAQVIDTPDKENAVYLAGQVFQLTNSDPDYAPLAIANFVFGSSPLSSRLSNRVRQKEGLSYEAGSQFSASALDKEATFQIFAICNPKFIDKLDRAIAEEFQRFLKEGIGAKELDDGKKAFLEQLRVDRGDDSALASMLSRSLSAGRTFAFYAELDRQLAGLTVEKVNAAVRKYLDPNKLIIVRAGDFKKK